MTNDDPAWVRALTDTARAPNERILLALLERYQGKNESAWPKIETLAKDMGKSVRTVQRLIRSLCDKGRLIVERPENQGRGMDNHYRVVADGTEGCQKCHPSESGKGDKTVAERVTKLSRHIRKKGSVKESVGARTKKHTPTKAHEFTPPTVAEVRAYAESRGYPNFDAERFVEYYAVADWHDKKGEPVRNWKQKMLSQWLKPKDGQAIVAETLGCGPCDEEDARRTLREAGVVLRDEP